MIFNQNPEQLFSRHIGYVESVLIPSAVINALDDLFDTYSDMLYEYLQKSAQNCKKFYLSESRGFAVEYKKDTSAFVVTQLFFGNQTMLKPFSASPNTTEAKFFTKSVQHYMQNMGWTIGINRHSGELVIFTNYKL